MEFSQLSFLLGIQSGHPSIQISYVCGIVKEPERVYITLEKNGQPAKLDCIVCKKIRVATYNTIYYKTRIICMYKSYSTKHIIIYVLYHIKIKSLTNK